MQIKYNTIKYKSICASKQVVEHVSPPKSNSKRIKVGAMTHSNM